MGMSLPFMQVPKDYIGRVTQDQLDEWYSDAADNCRERMEDPSDEDIHTWATFSVEERLKQLD